MQRLPTAYLLPIVAQTEIRHLRLKGSFGQNTPLLVAEEVNIIDEQFGHIVACPGRCFARVRQVHGYSPWLMGKYVAYPSDGRLGRRDCRRFRY